MEPPYRGHLSATDNDMFPKDTPFLLRFHCSDMNVEGVWGIVADNRLGLCIVD